MFLLVSLSTSKFFTCVALTSFVQHSCRTCVALVLLVSQSCHQCCTRVAFVSLVQYLCCTCVVLVSLASHSCRQCHICVARVALVSLVSGTRVVNQTRSSVLLVLRYGTFHQPSTKMDYRQNKQSKQKQQKELPNTNLPLRMPQFCQVFLQYMSFQLIVNITAYFQWLENQTNLLNVCMKLYLIPNC